ncbi:DgyrCDS13233 [Dimorphilus gyrociliatus]|uniref:DgyrCDS13233 n=1 Tax=Dimorphilus gyrociliatus TaxID=2664684 RepID=A0A7I8WA25_9ANNE|nr:DgyrCDS13233 [Dimorphilus gyrociliatus]
MKIVLFGPRNSGKSTIANYIAAIEPYSIHKRGLKPTKGVRIIEFDAKDVLLRVGKRKCDIELWDVGEPKTEFMKSIFRNADGVIIVFDFLDGDYNELHQIWINIEKSLLWAKKPVQCSLFVVNKTTAGTLKMLPTHQIDLKLNPESIRSEFIIAYNKLLKEDVYEVEEESEEEKVVKDSKLINF